MRRASKILEAYAKALELKCGCIEHHFQRYRLDEGACGRNLDLALKAKHHVPELAILLPEP